jgi:5-methylcytosine-specific restriction endonuclease McrA
MGLKRQETFSTCVCCGRTTYLTFHHLIPRTLHKRKAFKKHYSREVLNQGIAVCRPCHTGIHTAYEEIYLAKHLYRLELILADPTLNTHFKWVAKQKVI